MNKGGLLILKRVKSFFFRIAGLIETKFLLVKCLCLYLLDFYQYLVVIFWLIGILFAQVISQEFKICDTAIVSILVMVAIVSLRFLFRVRKNIAVKLVLFLIIFSVGFYYGLLRNYYTYSQYLKVKEYFHGNAKLEFQLVELPKGRGAEKEYKVKTTSLSDLNFVFLIRLPRYQSIRFNQKCIADLSLSDNIKGQVFEGVFFRGEVANFKCTQSNENIYALFMDSLLSFRSFISDTYSKHLGEPLAGLLYGIVTGDNPYFPKEFDNKVRNAGVMHIVAASGANVAVLILLVSRVSKYLPNSIRGVLTTLILVTYSLIAGLSPSIVRATIMMLLIIFIRGIGRKNAIILTLLYSSFFFTLITPTIIVSAGFLLSIAATAGIILLQPILQYHLSWLKESILTVFAVTLATTPVTAFFFGTFSLTGIIANIIAVPAIEEVMQLGLIGLVIERFSDVLASILFQIIFFLLKYFELLINVLGSFPLYNFGDITQGNSSFLACYFLCLFVVIILILDKKFFENYAYYF